ncbi:MAG: DNA methyltransferase [Caulobacterales bacterium]
MNIPFSHLPCTALQPNPRNARTHSKKQVKQIAGSIERFGFTNPILIDDANMILAGHGRLEAAKLLKLDEVPVIRLSHMSEADKRAYVLADNKLALNAGWDKEMLAQEFEVLRELNFDLEITGFEIAEIDLVLEADRETKSDPSRKDDVLPKPAKRVVTELGDVWVLGRHRLLCGDARDAKSYDVLMEGDAARIVFTDPPYNVPIDGFVGGKGAIKHREFAEGAGEMNEAEFIRFLSETLGNAAARACDGAILYVCMDWRHITEVLAAAKANELAFKNLCVWVKDNGGMGTFYRSRHELVFVFKKGQAPHINTFELGQHGRYRTNVWEYAGVNTRRAGRLDELAMHPTVKPVAMIADALKDCAALGDIVLDPFGGSGSTLIAAQKTGRIARLIELDPLYCDVIVRRWQAYTGKKAMHAGLDLPFDEVEDMFARAI